MINTDKLKQVGTSRYTEERFATRIKACDYFQNKKDIRMLELYAAGGVLTDLYKERFPEAKFIRVDNQKESNDEVRKNLSGTFFVMDNKNFIDNYLLHEEPFDIIDFDAYGDSFPLINEFFKKITNSNRLYNKFVVTFTNGLGLHLKRTKKIDWNKRFLIESSQVPNLRYPWKYHIELGRIFFNRLSILYNYNVEEIRILQSKNKNFIFGTYLFTK